MDLKRYDEVLGMYSAGVLLKDISVRLGVHVNVVQRYVAEGRRRGDVRASYRRVPGSSVPNLVLYLLQENGEVSWDDLRVSLWAVDQIVCFIWLPFISLFLLFIELFIILIIYLF